MKLFDEKIWSARKTADKIEERGSKFIWFERVLSKRNYTIMGTYQNRIKFMFKAIYLLLGFIFMGSHGKDTSYNDMRIMRWQEVDDVLRSRGCYLHSAAACWDLQHVDCVHGNHTASVKMKNNRSFSPSWFHYTDWMGKR